MYDYITPAGYGDTFYQYVLDAQDENPALVNGTSVFRKGPRVTDGDFLLRYWAGLSTFANSLQLYDQLGRQFFGSPAILGTAANPFANMVVAPEVLYPVDSDIRFDLGTLAQTIIGVDGALTIFAAQMVFTGVRRRPLFTSDPAPSQYPYYEKVYQLPFSLVVNNLASTGGILNASVRSQILINDFDFELRRIELATGTDGAGAPLSAASHFKLTLYDGDNKARSNKPVLSNMLCHLDPKLSAGEMNYWPAPGILYRINQVISMDVYSLLPAGTVLPVTFNLLFHGVRRIPCA